MTRYIRIRLIHMSAIKTMLFSACLSMIFSLLSQEVRAPRPQIEIIESEPLKPDAGSSLCCELPRDLVVGRHLRVRGDLHVEGTPFFEQGVPGTSSNILIVKKDEISGPNEFNTVNDAVDSITTNSVTNRFVIVVYPGIYVENTITLKPYVSLIAEAPLTVTLTPDDPSKDIVIAAPFSIIQGLQFSGATDSGKAAIVFNGGGVTGVDRCVFNNCDVFINQDGTTGLISTLYLTENFFGTLADFSVGVKVRSSGGIPTTCIIDGLAWHGITNPSLTNVIDISGPQIRAFFNVLDIGWLTPAGSTGIKITNGASVSLRAASINGFDQGIYIENAGSGPFLSIAAVSGSNNTEDMRIDHPATTGSVSASFARTKVIIDSATVLAVNLVDPEDQGTVTVGPKFVGDQIDLVTNISPAIQQGSNIGALVNASITPVTGLNVNVGSGSGYLMTGLFPDDHLKFVEWDAQSITLPANADSFIFIDEESDLQSSLSRPSFTGAILIGKARTNATNVVFVQAVEKDATHTGSRIDESWRQGLGGIYISGSIVSKNGFVQLDVSSGSYFFGTINFTPSGGTPISWLAFYRNGSGNYTIVNQNTVDFDHYDNGSGTLAAVPAGQFVRHALYIVNDGAEEKYLLVYGQELFASSVDAEVGGIPPQPGTWTDNITLIASIVVENTGVAGASTISEILDERPRLAFKASSVTAVTIHGDLTGLLNDDHPQYLLVNGSRAMSGTLNMGNHAISNVGLIGGVNLASHAARHLPNGADPLATAAPLALGITNSEGIANSFARSDHVHAHGNQTDQSLHAVATTALAGFMSAADKTKLDGITPSDYLLKAGDTMTGNLVFSNQNQIHFNELSFNGANFVGVRAPALLASSYTLTLPTTVGLSGQVLATDGSGTLSWSSVAEGDISNGGNAFGTPITIGTNDNFALSLETNGSNRLTIANNGQVTISNLSTEGVLHNNASGLLSTSLILDADIDASAEIADTKLATISATGKVLNSATTATSANIANAIVARDVSGNFAAGTITANLIGNVTGTLSGNITGAASLNVLKSGDTMTGSLQLPIGSAAAPSLNFAGSTTTGISAPTANTLTLSTAGTSRLQISSTGAVTIPNLSTTGIVHNAAGGLLSTSLIVDADIDANAGIDDTKLATISATGKVLNSATTATSTNVASAIVARDVSGNFAAGTITANVVGNLTGTATTATSLSGSLVGDVAGTQGATVVATVGGQSATNVAAATVLANAATSANTANAIVRRDASGNISVGTITGSLNGNITGAASLNVLKSGDTMTGSLQLPLGSAAAPSLNFTGSTTTGISVPTADTLTLSTAGTNRLSISSTGAVTIPNLSTLGIVHNSAAGLLSSSLIVNADIDAAASIADTKLATISTAGKVLNSATTATNANVASAIVARDVSGNFAAGTITANVVGNLTGTATTAANFSGSLVGDVTGTQGATAVATVGGQSATNVAAATVLANAATSANTANAIVRRDASGNISVGTITGSVTGNITGAASLNVLKTGDTLTGSLLLSNQSQVRLGSSGATYVALQAPASVSSNLTLTLPSVDGIANQTLATNASGVLSWVHSPSSLQNYRVHAYVSSNISLSIGGTSVIGFNTKVFDPNNNYNNSNYTYTAPVTGLYFVSAHVSVTAALALTRRLQLVKNGTAVTGFSTATLLLGGGLGINGPILLTAGDTLRVDFTGGLGDVILGGDSALFIYCIAA